MRAFDALDALKSKVIPAVVATFALFIEFVSDAISSSSKLTDRLSLSLSPLSTNETSRLNDDAASAESCIYNKSTFVNS
jgi:hypothetical protein